MKSLSATFEPSALVAKKNKNGQEKNLKTEYWFIDGAIRLPINSDTSLKIVSRRTF